MFPRLVFLYCGVGLSAYGDSGGGGGVRDTRKRKIIPLGLTYLRDGIFVLHSYWTLASLRPTHSLHSGRPVLICMFSDRIVKESFVFPTVFVVYHVRFLPLAIVASNELLRYLVSVLSSIFFSACFFLPPGSGSQRKPLPKRSPLPTFPPKFAVARP